MNSWERRRRAAAAVGGRRVPVDHLLRVPLNEGSGAPAASDGTTGTVNTTPGATTPPWVAGGPFGDAPRFEDGVNGTWQFDLSTPLAASADWTIAVWASIEAGATSRWLGTLTRQATSDDRRVGCYPYNETVNMWVAQHNAGWDSERWNPVVPSSYRGDGWHHWVCTFDGTAEDFAVYVDGALVTPTPIDNVQRSAGDLSATTWDQLHLAGRWDGDNPITGSVQDWRYYGRILAADEVAALHAVGAAGLT